MDYISPPERATPELSGRDCYWQDFGRVETEYRSNVDIESVRCHLRRYIPSSLVGPLQPSAARPLDVIAERSNSSPDQKQRKHREAMREMPLLVGLGD